MSSVALLRTALRVTSVSLRPPVYHCARETRVSARLPAAAPRFGFSSSAVRKADDHEESFEEFTARYEKEFEQVQDVFELQRNLNNAFAYDLVPSPSVITAALRAARRVNDFPTAVRIFEGIKAKVENQGQYDEYLKELEPLREELGINLKESMYPDGEA
ncbi:cytochrome c oxidase subunit VA-domain-containing protein [Lineolata rhizophorae]|uniref:Cytochrome c oxidase subunit 6, mitochondrial n=1 Tax=Lineolata rhizophorae TaxID=578093 RepID=A0A6A6NV24_9PEZI|nr:cytochrome c oxidase subunit VA-domain-containing protein [Lineolata rhizophorae]